MALKRQSSKKKTKTRSEAHLAFVSVGSKRTVICLNCEIMNFSLRLVTIRWNWIRSQSSIWNIRSLILMKDSFVNKKCFDLTQTRFKSSLHLFAKNLLEFQSSLCSSLSWLNYNGLSLSSIENSLLKPLPIKTYITGNNDMNKAFVKLW